jgi:hypothetical protein
MSKPSTGIGSPAREPGSWQRFERDGGTVIVDFDEVMDRLEKEWTLICAHYAKDTWLLTFATPTGKFIELASGSIGKDERPGFIMKEVKEVSCFYGKGVDQNVKW